MNFSIVTGLAGGIGLFLLGMRLLTDGLKLAAGSSLRRILTASTRTPLVAIVSGAFLTSLVQSSSAVTVAIIGFVNAGIMDLFQAVSLVYGTNLGTTMTGWLVSLVGFHINIQLFALPAVGLGMFLRILSHGGRVSAMGDVLAGFGIFFLGIDILKLTLEGLGNTFDIANLTGEGPSALFLYSGTGFLLTCLMQSSSAAIAIILTAVVGGLIHFHDAAAMVIGANVGTTSTAALAVIGATSNAKRLAAAHVIFNLITGLVALLCLPILLGLLHRLPDMLGLESTETTMLALFHTTFNLLGIILLYPLTGRLVTFLEKQFVTPESNEARPRYLDHTVAATPVLALQALVMELKRMSGIARRMAKAAISMESGPAAKLMADKAIIDELVVAVGEFGKKMQQFNIPRELGDQLPDALRVSGYLTDMADFSLSLATLQADRQHPLTPELAGEMAHFKSRAVFFLTKTDLERKEFSLPDWQNELAEIKEEYRTLKTRLLRAASKGELTARQMVNCLEVIYHIRHIAGQSEKTARYLAGIKHDGTPAGDSAPAGISPRNESP